MTARLRIAVVAEDELGSEVVTRLTDVALEERAPWVRDASVDSVREWLPAGPFRSFYKTSDVPHEVHVHGRFRPELTAEHAVLMARVYQWLSQATDADIVVVTQDLDNHATDRRQGHTQAAKLRSWPFRVVLALARPEIEAWLVATARDSDDASKTRIERVRKELGFDPTKEPHELLHGREAASPRNAKRVLDALFPDGLPELDAHALDVLSRQEECGSAAFIRDLDVHVVTPVAGPPRAH